MSSKLMTHIVYGYPDIETSTTMLGAFDKLGVEYVEVQIPFSDPIADGPVLTHANSIAALHVSTDDTLSFLTETVPGLRKSKVLIMCYFQSIFAYGIDSFCARAAQAGIYGLLVPDLPYDQPDYQILKRAADKYKTYLVPVLSPVISKERLTHYVKSDTSFIYLTARSGITGTHTSTQQITTLTNCINAIRLIAPTSELALGFGLQTVNDVAHTPPGVSVSVVGTAITEHLEQFGTTGTIQFTDKLLQACHSAHDSAK
jgi:tryptophan synthase alpha chain